MAKEKDTGLKPAKFTVENLVKDVGIMEQSIRVQLRNNKIKKRADGVYGWDSRTEYDDVKAKCWGDKKKTKKKAEATPAKKAAPAKKVAAKKKAPKTEGAEATTA